MARIFFIEYLNNEHESFHWVFSWRGSFFNYKIVIFLRLWCTERDYSILACFCQATWHRHGLTSIALILMTLSTSRRTDTVRRNSTSWFESLVLHPSTSPSRNAFFRGLSSSAHELMADPLWDMAWWNSPAGNLCTVTTELLRATCHV